MYDTVVIGAGLSGLTCAAYLADAGQNVLVLERRKRLGGYAVSYSLRGYSFDIAIQNLGGCEPGGGVAGHLEELGVRDRITFLRSEPARRYYFQDGKIYDQKGDWREQRDRIKSEHPGFARRIDECYRVLDAIFQEMSSLGEDADGQVFRFSNSCPILSRYGRHTVAGFFQEIGLPEEAVRKITGRSGYCMLSHEELSLAGFACLEMSYKAGSWVVKGGVQRLTDLLAERVQSARGEIREGTPAVRLEPGQDGLWRIRTREEEFFANNVVAACASSGTLASLLSEHLPRRYQSRMQRFVSTGSYFISFYSVPQEAVEGMAPNIEVQGESKDGPDVLYVLIPSLVDPSASPRGMHGLCLSKPLAYGDKPDKTMRKRIRAQLERAATTRFPSLKGKLKHLLELHPGSLEALSGNPCGSAYGWALTPGQTGIFRQPLKGPIPNLYLTGHWTMPGGGIPAVMTSGRLCAKQVLKDSI